ncbi:MAG: vanadium-dependent haloperoxidase [Pseudomonadota bacterium]
MAKRIGKCVDTDHSTTNDDTTRSDAIDPSQSANKRPSDHSYDAGPALSEPARQAKGSISRRTLVGVAMATSAAAPIVAPGAAAARSRFKPWADHKGRASESHAILGPGPIERRFDALDVRTKAAATEFKARNRRQQTNGDDDRYRDFRASFTKTLEHDPNTGLADRRAYRRLQKALDDTSPEAFDRIPLSPEADRRLANPQAAFRFELTGTDGHQTRMPAAPAFESKTTAAEMGEVYWKSLCRDVPFSTFESDPLIGAAVADLNGSFSKPVGPTANGFVTSDTVFRGETPGDLVGPYISQLLVQNIPYGNIVRSQAYPRPAEGFSANYMTNKAEWLSIQNGAAPAFSVFNDTNDLRYISTGRQLGEYVHVDFTFQAYLNAALVLLATGAFDSSNPYASSATQGGFITFGAGDVLHLVTKAGNLSLTGAWYQKWLVHRRLRPEAYGGRLNAQKMGGFDFQLPEIGASEALDRVFNAYGTYFLPMAYPEGSPTHPAYPAGHATVAGACCTVLKAFFDESAPYPSPKVPSEDGRFLNDYFGPTLTIGGEINKLANNISLGRDWSGVHYRSDGVEGLETGEQQALGLLADYSRTYNEDFDGFSLTTYSGKKILIKNGTVFGA